MPVTVCISSISDRRIARARLWLEARASAQEVLIVASNLAAANELARSVCQTRGAAFGWHRITFAQLAAVLAAPTLAGAVSCLSVASASKPLFVVPCTRSDQAMRLAAIPEFPRGRGLRGR
jgi:hypothetical protein